MNAPENQADAAWERILPKIRATRRHRRHRRTRKIATATAFCAMLGIWLGMRFSQPSEIPIVPPVAHVTPTPPTAAATLAILRISHDGTARMEEVSCHELDEIELTFSLAPVITFAHHE